MRSDGAVGRRGWQARSVSAWLGSARLGPARFGLAGSARSGSAWLGAARLGAALFGPYINFYTNFYIIFCTNFNTIFYIIFYTIFQKSETYPDPHLRGFSGPSHNCQGFTELAQVFFATFH